MLGKVYEKGPEDSDEPVCILAGLKMGQALTPSHFPMAPIPFSLLSS